MLSKLKKIYWSWRPGLIFTTTALALALVVWFNARSEEPAGVKPARYPSRQQRQMPERYNEAILGTAWGKFQRWPGPARSSR